MHIWPEGRSCLDDLLEVRVRIEMPGMDPAVLWYRFPAQLQSGVTESLDPFVIGTVFLAMRHASGLRVHGPVSPSLLRNLEEFQAVWSCWLPDRYHGVEIQADAEVEDEPAPVDAALMTFSGGLDSCFTAWRHTRGNCDRRRRKLESALMVHGFDIPLAEPETFARAADNSRRLAGDIGLELIPLACNFRQLKDDWEQAHGAALASCLHLFRRRFSTGLIAGSHAYNAMRFP